MTPSRYTTLAMLDVAALSAALLAARTAAWLLGNAVVPPVLLAGAAVASSGVIAYRQPSVLPTLERGARTAALAGVGLLLGGAVLSFFPETLFRPERLWLCALVTLLVAAVRSLRVSLSLSSIARRGIDVIVLVSTVLLVSNVTGYGSALRYDYDFFLGPVNAMRHGHPLLVDTFSQYGVGIFYALGRRVLAVPLSYGGLQFVLCVAYGGLSSQLVYSRAAPGLADRNSWPCSGFAVAVVANLVVSGTEVIAYPSTGPLRFGLPWVVILAGDASSSLDRSIDVCSRRRCSSP